MSLAAFPAWVSSRKCGPSRMWDSILGKAFIQERVSAMSKKASWRPQIIRAEPTVSEAALRFLGAVLRRSQPKRRASTVSKVQSVASSRLAMRAP